MTTRRLLAVTAAGAAALVAVALLRVGDGGSARAGGPWEFPPGAWVRLHDVDSQGGRTVETDEVWTVLERDGEIASVEIRRSGAGFIPAVETLKIGLRDEIDSLEGARPTGRATISAGGAPQDCETWERSTADSSTRLWTRAGSRWPLRIVQQRRGTTPEEVEREWLGARETIRVADVDLACERFRETRRLNGQVVEEGELWLHADVPGHVVRRIQRVREKDGEANIRVEATGFGAGGSRKP